MMRKLLSITMLLVFSVAANAQKDVTRFLGIPVEGSKAEMIRQIKAKGYRSISPYSDILEGEFKGMDVVIHVNTPAGTDKVYGIQVSDTNHVDERSIRIRFNRLCEQFTNDPEYVSLEDQTIPDDEDISYEMRVNNKRYNAVFYQQPISENYEAVKKEWETVLSSKYTEEQLADPSEEVLSDCATLYWEYMAKLYTKKTVWFTILEFEGKYFISMSYDNNEDNEEDL